MTKARPIPTSNQTMKRVDYIDLLRGWAVIVMVEVHVFNATLSPEVTIGGAFQYIKFLNGLVAPSFLFASGLAYAVTTRRKFPDYMRFGNPLFRQLGRLLTIGLIGYLLHVPAFPVTRLFSGLPDASLQSFFQVDILQCIAVSLLVLQLLLLIVRSEKRLFHLALIIACVVVIVTPFMWQTDYWERMPWLFAAYLNGAHYSLFPLFPWAGFLLIGSFAGYSYSKAREAAGRGIRGAEEKWMESFAWAGASAILLSIAVEPLGSLVYPDHNYWVESPSFFLLRLGIVMLLCALIFFASTGPPTRPRSVTLLFGRESLFIYVSHLLIIYGNFGPFNFQEVVDHTFGYPMASAVTIILLMLTFGAARFWNRVKRTSPRTKTFLNVATVVVVAAILLFAEN